jgi:hypothetical protein
LIYRVLVERVVGKLAFRDLDPLQVFNVLPYYPHNGLIAGACVSQGQCDDSASNHRKIDGGNYLIVNFRNVIHQVIPLVDFVERVLIDESDEFGDLIEDEGT